MTSVVIGALLPVFFVLGLGYLAGKRGLVDNRNVRSINTLVMDFALPVALFVATAQTPRGELVQKVKLIEVLGLSMWLIYAIHYWVQRRFFGASPAENSVRTLTVALPNYASIGLPLLGSVLGPKSAVDVAVAIAAGALLAAPITLVILAGGNAAGGGAPSAAGRFVHALVHLLRRPVVFGPLLGVAVSALGWHLPGAAVRALTLIGQAAPGAALFLTGLVLSAQPVRLSWPVGIGVVLKNLAEPAVALALVGLLGLTGPAGRSAVLLAAIPTGFFGIVFGLAHNVKSETAGSALTISSLASIVTLTLAIEVTGAMH